LTLRTMLGERRATLARSPLPPSTPIASTPREPSLESSENAAACDLPQVFIHLALICVELRPPAPWQARTIVPVRRR
jgi:hypothetical protein